jgi:hypothetical protein
MLKAAQHEQLLIKAATTHLTEELEIGDLTSLRPSNFNKRRIIMQLMMLNDFCKEKSVPN